MTASDQAIREAAEVYAAILNDPVRAAEIRAARSAYASERGLEFCNYCATVIVPAERVTEVGDLEADAMVGPCTHRSRVHCLRIRDWEMPEGGIRP